LCEDIRDIFFLGEDSVGRGFETHPAHLVEGPYYLGFRLSCVGGLEAKTGLWYPKWYPKNSGCLAGTERGGGELRGPPGMQEKADLTRKVNRYFRGLEYGAVQTSVASGGVRKRFMTYLRRVGPTWR